MELSALKETLWGLGLLLLMCVCCFCVEGVYLSSTSFPSDHHLLQTVATSKFLDLIQGPGNHYGWDMWDFVYYLFVIPYYLFVYRG